MLKDTPNPSKLKMNCLWMVVVLAGIIKLGGSLKCYENSIAPVHCKMKAVTCEVNDRCFKRVGKLETLMIASRGCIPLSNCGRTVSNTFAGKAIKLKTTCCVKELCNGGKDMTVPLAQGSVLLLGCFLCVNM